jgi:uncharacterized protein (TIGR04255 family)
MGFPNLKNAPIAEAVIQITFDKTDVDVLSHHNEFFLWAEKEFPLKEPQYDIGQSENPNLESYSFTNIHKNKILNISRNSFSLHYVEYYRDWIEFKDDAETYWGVFTNSFKPSQNYEISLRYINIFELSTPLRMEDYFKLGSVGDDDFGYPVHNFLNRYKIFEKESKSFGEIILGKDQSFKHKSKVRIILDIDVSTRYLDSDIWVKFEKLRQLKNDIFFKIVTDKLIQEYK